MKTVVIVDDEPVDRYILENLVSRHIPDWEIVSFPNATKALNYLDFRYAHTHTVPEIILLDLIMPLTDGCEFLHQLRLTHYYIAGHRPDVFVLTVSDNVERHRQALRLGARAILSKPLSAETITTFFKGC